MIALNSLHFTTELMELNRLLETAQARVTCLGTRLIVMDGQSASLEALARKVVNFSTRCARENPPIEYRNAGAAAARKLQNFYQITDTQLRSANIFTRFLTWAREFSFIPHTPRFYIEEERAAFNFHVYAGADFIRAFPEQARA